MNARLVNQVVGSPVFAKLILLACVSALFLYLRRKDTEGQSSAFLALLGILVVRDFLSAYYFSPQLLYVSDIFYLCFVLFILLALHDGSRQALVLIIGLNTVAAALFIGIFVFDLPVTLPDFSFGSILVVDVFVAGLVSFLNWKDRSTPARHLVSLIWPFAVLFLLAYTILALVMGYNDPFFFGFVMPVSYAWLFAAALFRLGIQEAEMVKALAYYEAAIDSLYAMFLGTGSAIEDGIRGLEVLNRLNEILVSETGADGGVILLPDGPESVRIQAYSGFFPPLLPVPDRLPRNAGAIETYMKQARFGFGEGFFGDVAKTGMNVYCPAAEHDPRFASNSSDGFPHITSFMSVPFMIEDRILGVSALVKTAAGSPFKEADFDRFKLLANFGSFAVSTLLPAISDEENEQKSPVPGSSGTADAIDVIQEAALTRKLPRFPGLSADVMTLPAPGSAGTYHDLIQARKDRIIGIMGEAAGPGLKAALALVMLKSVLHVLGRTDKDMAAILNWANRVLNGCIETENAPSVGLACLNPLTGGFEYASAGRLSLLVYRHGTKSLDYISRASIPIGRERVADYERIRLQMQAGDLAVMYTEGVTGCLDSQGNQFGRNALARAVVRHAESSTAEIAAGIRVALSAFSGKTLQQSDRTVFVFRLE